MKFAVALVTITVTLFSSSAALVLADPAPVESITVLDPIIISSSRIPTSLDTSVTSTQVIDKIAIEASGATSVAELLRFQGGLHVQQNGSRGSISSVYLRNTDPNFVSVYVDGVKVNESNNSRGGSFDFSTIDIHSVDRIEIVKGTMSSMHGSDALAGVIYITTRSAEKRSESQASVTAGSRGFREAHGQIQGKYAQTSVAVNVSYLDEGQQLAYSGFINRSASFNANTFIGEAKKLTVQGRYIDSNALQLPDDSGGEEFAVIRESESRFVTESSLGGSFTQDVTSIWSYNVAFNQFVHNERVDSPGVAPGIRDPFGIPANTGDSTLKRDYASGSNNFEINPALQLSFGLDYQSEKGKSDSSLDTGFGIVTGYYDLERDNLGVFLETLYQLTSDLTTRFGIRYDDPEYFESENTANLGLRYIFQHFAVTLNAGTGYKLPSFFSLGNSIVGNPDLLPEKSKFWEASVRRIESSSSWGWHFNVYAYEFKNLIDFDAGPPPSMVNRNKVSNDGAEVGVRRQWQNRNSVSLGIDYSETNIEGTNEQLRNRPRWRATGMFQHFYSSALNSVLSALYVDEVYESSIATGNTTLDAYLRIDLSLNWQHSENWLVAAVIENITNESYYEMVGTESPGLTFKLSVKAKY